MQANSVPSDSRKLKRGERLWHWSADAPTPFEMMLVGHLSDFTDSESPNRNNGVFRVSIYSWRGDVTLTSRVLGSIPRTLEARHPRLITFLEIDKEMKVQFPTSTLFQSSNGSFVNMNQKEILLRPGIVLLVTSRQLDYDGEGDTLVGHDDTVGIVSLIAGHLLSRPELLSSYFCTKRKKFLCGHWRISEDPSVARTVIPLSELRETNLDARDEKTHAALWFAGKAFAARDHASKLIFYKVALESAARSRNIENFFRRLYKGRGPFTDHIMNLIKLAKSDRDDIVHNGERRTLSSKVERYLQAAIIDALRYQHGLESDGFAALDLYRTEMGETQNLSSAP